MAKTEAFGGYGTPFFPEVIGMAQEGLAKMDDVPAVEPVFTNDRGEKSEEQFLFEGYEAAVAENEQLSSQLAQVQEVFNTGMVPPAHGVEVGFVTVDGFYNSVAPSVQEAVKQGVQWQLAQGK